MVNHEKYTFAANAARSKKRKFETQYHGYNQHEVLLCELDEKRTPPLLCEESSKEKGPNGSQGRELNNA